MANEVHQTYININTINARSLKANEKLKYIKDWHRNENHTVTVITESWLDHYYFDPVLTQTPPAPNRGVATLIDPTTVTNIQPIFKELWNPSLNAIVIHTTASNTTPIIIIGYYCQPPNQKTNEKFLVEFINGVKRLKGNIPLVVAGDFNQPRPAVEKIAELTNLKIS